MAENENKGESSGLTRRQLIKRAAIIGGAVAWAAPVIRMATGSGDPKTVNIDGAQLIEFSGPCGSVLLTPVSTTRTVCAKTVAAAKTAYKSQVTTECNAKCPSYGPCATNSCKTKAKNGTTVGTTTCTGPGPNCPVPPYATGTKEYICTAVVTCVCVCRA